VLELPALGTDVAESDKIVTVPQAEQSTVATLHDVQQHEL